MSVAVATGQVCDRCGAPARVEVTLPSGGLLTFCGHHFAALGRSLPAGCQVADRR